MATPKRIARVEIEERRPSTSGKEQSSNGLIEHFAGNPLRIDFLFTRNEVIITDADITNVAVSILDTDFTGASYADASSTGFDVAVTETTWADKSSQHAYVEFTGAELELPITRTFSDYVVVCFFGDYTFGYVTLRLYRDGIPSGMLPVQAGNAIPVGATYDIAGEYTPTLNQDTYYIVGFGADDTSLVNDATTLTKAANNLDVFQAGSVIVMHGTPSAAVTAIVRPNPVATTAIVNQMMTTGIAVANAFPYIWRKVNGTSDDWVKEYVVERDGFLTTWIDPDSRQTGAPI